MEETKIVWIEKVDALKINHRLMEVDYPYDAIFNGEHVTIIKDGDGIIQIFSEDE